MREKHARRAKHAHCQSCRLEARAFQTRATAQERGEI
jgi:hypothetical protein